MEPSVAPSAALVEKRPCGMRRGKGCNPSSPLHGNELTAGVLTLFFCRPRTPGMQWYLPCCLQSIHRSYFGLGSGVGLCKKDLQEPMASC